MENLQLICFFPFLGSENGMVDPSPSVFLKEDRNGGAHVSRKISNLALSSVRTKTNRSF